MVLGAAIAALGNGGSEGRPEATGRGCQITTLATLKHLGIRPQDATVAVQGVGNVGYTTAKLLQQSGCKVIAVSDTNGACYNEGGIDLDEVVREKELNGRLRQKVCQFISNDELLELPVTVLVPAALENQITARNANRIKARIICEGANGPTTPEADEILTDKGVFIIPDILANAGGVTVSYFEWVQDLQEFFWDEHDINERLERIMLRAFDNVLRVSLDKKVNMRTAAYVLAVDKVAPTTRSTRKVYYGFYGFEFRDLPGAIAARGRPMHGSAAEFQCGRIALHRACECLKRSHGTPRAARVGRRARRALARHR